MSRLLLGILFFSCLLSSCVVQENLQAYINVGDEYMDKKMYPGEIEWYTKAEEQEGKSIDNQCKLAQPYRENRQ